MSDEYIKSKIAEGLQIALNTRKMSQKDLAIATGTAESTISRYVNGSSIPNSILLMKICSILGLSFEYFSDILEGKSND